MKGHVKRAIDTLEALGFTLDEDASYHGKRFYRHVNDPETVLKVFSGASEPAMISVMRKAQKIAETGWSGPAMPKTIGERARINRAKATLVREREKAAYERRASAAEQRYQDVRAIEEADRRRREIESLMRPGGYRS